MSYAPVHPPSGGRPDPDLQPQPKSSEQEWTQTLQTVPGLTAEVTMKMLEEKYPDMIVDWPPSSDLNLIENLWAILTEKV